MIRVEIHWWRRIHASGTVVWFLAIIPTLLWWHDSVLFVGIASCYANAVGHFSAWQGARAEASSNGGDAGPKT